MATPKISSFPRRMIALPRSVRRGIEERFAETERRIQAARKREPLIAEMLYRGWLDDMEAALREAEAAAESRGLDQR